MGSAVKDTLYVAFILAICTVAYTTGEHNAQKAMQGQVDALNIQCDMHTTPHSAHKAKKAKHT